MHILYGHWLTRLQRGYIYVGQHACSAGILHGHWLACLQRGYIYVGRHTCSTGILHGHWLAHLQQGHIYVGPYAYSAHDIPGPIHYMWLKDISRPRLAGTLYAPLWHIWKYACSIKISLKGLALSSNLHYPSMHERKGI